MIFRKLLSLGENSAEILCKLCSYCFLLPTLNSAVLGAHSLQLFLTLCNHIDDSPPDSSVHGILQIRRQEWVAMPSSRGSS